MSDEFDHLHLKRNTAGSSNELSFDVLDAARSESQQKKSRFSKGTKPVKGSYHGVKGQATLSGQDEVEKRKKRRAAHGMRIRLLVAVALIAAVGAGAWLGYQRYQSMQDFSERFEKIIAMFAEQDSFLTEIDPLMEAPIDENSIEKQAEALKSIPSATNKLSQVRTAAEELLPLSVSDADKMALDQVIDAVVSRQEMLSIAQNAFKSVGEEDEVAKQADVLWDKVLAADQTAREAAELSNGADTEEAIRLSQEKTKQASEELGEVKQLLSSFAGEHDFIDLADQIAYLDMRIESLDQALATGNALLEGDRDKAEESNAKYNDLDRKAVAKASELPLTLGDIARKSYAEGFVKLASDYQSARNRVISADALVREYLV